MYEDLDTFGTENGVVGLAAHSTRSTSPCAYCYFQNAGDIQEGDIITVLWKDGNEYKYVVYDTSTWQEENTPGMFEPVEGKSILVLQTCTNGQHGKRSYVHAERISDQ
jgi:LPXTG-site transpeptidase (sortase) family protein